MLKNLLYFAALCLLLASGYYIYQWCAHEPDNREPLPALISTIATIILTIIAWRLEKPDKSEQTSNGRVKVKKVKDTALVDVTEKNNSTIEVSEIKGAAQVLINKPTPPVPTPPPSTTTDEQQPAD